MTHTRKLSVLLVLAALGAGAQAQSDTTREQVKAEYLRAVQTGDISVGESGLTLRQLHPGQYAPRAVVASTVTRAQVKAEVAQALASGEPTVESEIGYVPRAAQGTLLVAQRSRADVKAETIAAVRSGDLDVVNELGLKASQLYPHVHAPVQAHASNGGNTTTAAAGY